MEATDELNKALAVIISGTRRNMRNVDLVTLVDNISYAESCMGGIKEVAEAVGLSVQQLRDFLTANKLCGEVRELVKKRAIDSVDIIKNISQLSNKRQIGLAQELTRGRLSSKEVRILTAFAKRFPRRSIHRILRDYYESRDKKTYIVEFTTPSDKSEEEVWTSFKDVVGESGLVSIQSAENMTTLELSSEGQKELAKAAKMEQRTLREFVSRIIRSKKT